ncbi:hypothetical protein H696_04250 [Fonticula alba]|uniref:Cytochrome b5 heme-binding domain-containing protein n=1 Tax=Fonticula alba TaxID=691883 RepID=A0A058Z5M9_FONAL|nr:hypothetical protein H696_04250 [Fonticula alba]KCV68832.1 hypothetical protein H696_04250 [Fonticula alba]|eukprot:XP_009496403.1 hypothetical protein H696_04250 [Fonticula alba]
MVSTFYLVCLSCVGVVLSAVAVYRMRLNARMKSAAERSLPKDQLVPYTVESLSKFDGVQTPGKIYLGIAGYVFDVSERPGFYGPGGSYSVYAGRDASRALACSTITVEDCNQKISGLTEKQYDTLRSWLSFFQKRYPNIGKMVDASGVCYWDLRDFALPEASGSGPAPTGDTMPIGLAGESSKDK